jgi:hypothetical protein
VILKGLDEAFYLDRGADLNLGLLLEVPGFYLDVPSIWNKGFI